MLPSILTVVTCPVFAAPTLFFGPEDLPALRERIKDPALAPVWEAILQKAEDRCNPKHKDYLDPESPFSVKAKGEHVPESRHAALIAHSIGRKLNNCMETVGFAYQITGRKEFGQHAAAFLYAIATTYPITNKTVSGGFAGGRGDLMRGLALGNDWVSDALTDAQRREVAEVAKGYVELFRKEFEDPKKWWYKVHNYNGVNGGAAGCLALTLREAYPEECGKWVADAVRIIERWLSTGFDEDGAYVEGVGYSGYGLSNTVLFADALRRAGSKQDLYRHPVFAQLGSFYALSILPGERACDARNDSNYVGLSGVPLALAKALNSGLYRWLFDHVGRDRTFQRILWDNNVTPVDPVSAGIPLAKHFRGRGLCVWRTGWTKDDVMFSVEAGPYYPITHNQADKGHFNLYGLGNRWAVDTGYSNERSPNGRGQAAAHSCVLIEGKGQAISGAGLGTDGEVLAYTNSDRCGYALFDCTKAYRKNNRDMPGVAVEFARRHTFFVYPRGQAPAYAVALDDIRKDDKAHAFTWQMMISGDMEAIIGEGEALLAPADASANAYVDTPWTSSDDAVASVVPGAPVPGELHFELSVENAGTYTVWARVRTLAEERAKADSFFVRMDDGRQVDWHMPTTGKWRWAKVAVGVKRDPVTYELTAGTHRLVFRRREPAAQIDCLLVTTETKTPPTLEGVRDAPLFREAESGTLAAPMRVVQTTPRPTRLLIRLDAVAPVSLRTDTCKTMDYHGPGAYPLLRADTSAINPRFAAVLVPLPAECPTPAIAFARTQDTRTITVTWPDHEDVITWPDQALQPPSLQ
ncbi:MAG: hypothetical protein HN742_13050 [Lentisphaerae bacterium]|nr:hypothetical protein [Lentisphaerota bacterium]MBT7058274.1 hypothetical protein [Lentisphaerota bacterium]MBT7842798.1 hypothetical protein [Lentisphaerota bacterium]